MLQEKEEGEEEDCHSFLNYLSQRMTRGAQIFLLHCTANLTEKELCYESQENQVDVIEATWPEEVITFSE